MISPAPAVNSLRLGVLRRDSGEPSEQILALEKAYGKLADKMREILGGIPAHLAQFQIQKINYKCNPDLCLHGVLCFSVELLDPEILLYGLEEDFDVPSCPVKSRDMVGRAVEDIRENCDFVPGGFVF